ncbi:MAG: hypothetical protein QW390_01740 [Candidatus Bathyarchaeia archaeon]
MTIDELTELLERQRQLEVRIANSLEETLNKTRNRVVRILIRSIMMDSLKHADILEALKEISKGYSLSEADRYELGRGIEKHISEEKEMLDKISKLAEKADDPHVKNMLLHIKGEEDRHHDLLNQLSTILGKAEVVSEEDWWDYFNRWSNFST